MTSAESLRLKPVDLPSLPPLVGIPPEGLSLGRAEFNSLALVAEEFPHVSSHHARIAYRGADLTIEDLGSKNGTLVNGEEVELATLRPGDVLQLGRKVGPRFVVVSDLPLGQTVSVTPDPPSNVRPPELGTASVTRLGHALGLPKERERVAHTLQRQRRGLLALGALLITVAAAAILGFLTLDEERRLEVSSLREVNEQLSARIEKTGEDVALQRATWEKGRSVLENERAELLSQIQSLQATERTSTAELASLEEKLTTTSEKLERMKPISLEVVEAERRAVLEKALQAVVFIEKTTVFRDTDSGELLHMIEKDNGDSCINLKGEGALVQEEGGGSGFCVAPAGWIITNAHVVTLPSDEDTSSLRRLKLEPEVRLVAVFSSTSTRHPAKVVRVAQENENDLALLKIEPFDGMGFLENVHPDLNVPAPGTELRLMGFPFGKSIPHDGDKITASVFGGVASRRVGAYLQINAAIYPGNSGGPVIEHSGRLVGVVTSVQTLPSGQIAEIGFVLPIARLADLWPPPASTEPAR